MLGLGRIRVGVQTAFPAFLHCFEWAAAIVCLVQLRAGESPDKGQTRAVTV
jgi:hypothetical protein